MSGPGDGAEATVPTAGWYPDPAGSSGAWRWWDGSGWTSWLSADPAAAAPGTEPPEPVAPEPVASAPEISGVAEPEAEEPPAAPVRPPGYERGRRSTALTPPGAIPARAPAEGPEPERGARHGPVRLMGVVAALAAAVVVAGVIVLGNRAPADQLAPPPPPATPSPSATTGSASSGASALTYDSASGDLGIGTFRTTLPGAPYLISNDLAPRPPILANGVEAAAVVQSRYDGSHDWDASLRVGELDESLVVKGDASATADKLLAATIKADFAGITVHKGTFTRKKIKNPNTEQVVILQGRLGYHVPKIKSRYDQVSLLVIETSDGRWIGWCSSRPEKASSAIQKSLKTSIDTIRT